MSPFITGGLVVAVFAISVVGTKIVMCVLTHRAILDRPNERSSHSTPTPTGGGMAICATVFLAWVLIGVTGREAAIPVLTICGLAVGLAVVSWIDDIRGLNEFIRIAAHIAAVTTALYLLPFLGPYFGDLLPYSLGLIGASLAWLWFINLYNFMDGIDGLAGVETVTVGAGLAVVAGITGVDGSVPVLGWTVAAAAAGFLIWNWHPAKVFMGDVGSVPLGFVLGWLLLTLAAHGQWAAALILPLYFVADSTWTLVRRALRGELVWKAHREHLYQKAVQRGVSHATVSRAVLLANLALIGLAVGAARDQVWAALAGAAIVLTALIVYLRTVTGHRAEPE